MSNVVKSLKNEIGMKVLICLILALVLPANLFSVEKTSAKGNKVVVQSPIVVTKDNKNQKYDILVTAADNFKTPNSAVGNGTGAPQPTVNGLKISFKNSPNGNGKVIISVEFKDDPKDNVFESPDVVEVEIDVTVNIPAKP